MKNEPPNSESPKSQNNTDKFHSELVRINKKAIYVLLSIVAGQFFLMNSVVDAGELTEKSLLECTNAIRSEYHDNKLYLNEQLSEAAYEKLQDMQEYGYWAHGNPVSGEMPWDFVDRAGYYYQTTGENLALGFESAQEICDAWEASETHLANIAKDTFQEVGFAINKANLHKNGKGILVVQMFGSRDSFTLPENAAEYEESGCLTSQSCKEESSALQEEQKVLGVSNENENQIIAFISRNIIIFVIICSFIIGKILLLLFYSHKPVPAATKKKKRKKKK